MSSTDEIWILCASASVSFVAEVAVIWAAYFLTHAAPPWYAVPVTLAALAPLALVGSAYALRIARRWRSR